jgi:DNA-binding NarL/FixJ family response regulator
MHRVPCPAPAAPPPETAPPGPTLLGVKVLIVDDCTLHRDNLAALIATNGAAEVCVAWDLPTLTEAIRDTAFSVILMNIATMDSAPLLRTALAMAPQVRVIVVGVSEDDEIGIVSCAEAGAAGYHTRGESIEDLLMLMSKVDAGESVCSPKVSAILLRRLSALASHRPPVAEDMVLTVREAEILAMLKLGLSNREIAEQLCIAVHTVKNHVHSLLTKLGVSTRGQAAALASTMQ